MNPFSVRLLATVCAMGVGATMLPAAEPAIIAKARAFIGTEETLNGLKSIHFVGALVTVDPENPGKELEVAMDISFQLPFQQRLVASSPRGVEITGLDGYDGWSRVEDPKDPSRGKQTILNVERVKRLRANTWENLSFYRGIEAVGGRVEDQGTVEIDGLHCRKLAFIHDPKIIFYRYFHAVSGQLILTETEGGDRIRELGEVVVSGIRFPRTLLTTSRNEKGEARTIKIIFRKVIVNEPIPVEQFKVPGYGKR